jgi:hypothetical protein
MAVFSQTPSFLAFFYLLYPPTTYLTRGYPLGRRSSDLRFAQVVVAPPTLNPSIDGDVSRADDPMELDDPE